MVAVTLEVVVKQWMEKSTQAIMVVERVPTHKMRIMLGGE